MTETKTSLMLDTEKFMVGYNSASYNVTYEVFKSDIDTTEIPTIKAHRLYKQRVIKEAQSCFSGFVSSYLSYTTTNKVSPNRLRFFCNYQKHDKKNTHLTKDEIEFWVELCKQNKLMPENIGKNFIENGIYDIHFEDISMDMMYVYLCAARYLQEEPFFVRGIIHLIKDNGLGFFTAFGIASYYLITNAAHHILPISRDYRACMYVRSKSINAPKKGDFGSSFDLIYIPRLVNFLYGGDAGKPIKNIAVIKHATYSLHCNMKFYWDKNYPATYIVNREDLTNTDLEPMLKAGEFAKPV